MTALQGGLLLTRTTRATRHLQLSLDMALHHIAGYLRDPSTTPRHRPRRPVT